MLRSRSLGLVLNPNDRSIQLSARIGEAVNHRFHKFDHGIKQGVSTPKTDEFILLDVHPRYKDNISRYMRVVRALAIRESTTAQFERLQLLERQLTDPLTAATAALRLEAIGKPAIPTLVKATTSQDPEVRFYAAECSPTWTTREPRRCWPKRLPKNRHFAPFRWRHSVRWTTAAPTINSGRCWICRVPKPAMVRSVPCGR